MTRNAAIEIARNLLPSDTLEFRLYKPIEEDGVLVWSGNFETADGAEGEFAFEDHYPEGITIEWA